MTIQRKKASDFPPEVLRLFDGFVHGRITRRDFLDRATQVRPGDPRIPGTHPGDAPRGASPAKLPAVVVIHENRGLNPYIENVARRLAAEGYVALDFFRETLQTRGTPP